MNIENSPYESSLCKSRRDVGSWQRECGVNLH